MQQRSSCFCLPSSGVESMHHHSWPMSAFSKELHKYISYLLAVSLDSLAELEIIRMDATSLVPSTTISSLGHGHGFNHFPFAEVQSPQS